MVYGGPGPVYSDLSGPRESHCQVHSSLIIDYPVVSVVVLYGGEP